MARHERFHLDLDSPQSSWSPMPQRSTRGDGEDVKATRRAEVDQIVAALREVFPGGLRRRDLARRVGASRWGPGRLPGALRQAAAEGLIRRTGWHTYRLTEPDDRT
jgi:hypothetical protein